MSSNKLKKLFEKKQNFFLFSILTKGDTIQDSLFKMYALDKILLTQESNNKFSEEELLILLEDFPITLSNKRILDLIGSLGILDKKDKKYIVKDSFLIEESSVSKGRRFPKEFKGIKVYAEQVKEVLADPIPEIPWTIRTIQDSIYKGLNWLHWTIQTASDPKSNLKGLPPFWLCKETGDESLGFKQAGTSNADTLGTLAESFFCPCSYQKIDMLDKKEVLNTGLKFVLNCQVTESRKFNFTGDILLWNMGGFMAYDDQPDAYYPTVDATWDALIALSMCYNIYDKVQINYGTLDISKIELKKLIISGLEFLLRMQMKQGAWGIYRYPDDSSPVFAHDFTTGYAIIALSLSKLTDIYDDSYGKKLLENVNSALLRAYEFIADKKQKYDSYSIWTPFFDTSSEKFTSSNLLKSTAWTCSGLLWLYRQFDDLKEDIKPLLESFVGFADKYWNLDYSRIAKVEFRVPLKDKLNDTFNGWKNRLDVTLTVLLLDLYNECYESDKLNISFPENIWSNIEGTVNNIIDEQHPEHGHWNEPVENMPLAAATMMAIQVLQYYLKAMKNMLKN